MTKQAVRKLPKRLQIDFKHKKPVYEVWRSKGCNRRDLITAGVSEEDADALVLNSYDNKPMRYTLIRPEEWFWTHRDWWKDTKNSSHLQAMYELCGGSFGDLTPREQADFLGVEFREETGRKAKGTHWIADDGSNVDIVRLMRGKLIEKGFGMAPAYSDGCSLMVAKTCRDRKVDPAFFSAETTPEERNFACQIVDEVLARPGDVWDERPGYYLQILNTLRSIKDFDRDAMLETLRILGLETYSTMLKHYVLHRTYKNQMSHVALPPLVGRKDGRLVFFYVTQKASFNKDVSNFVRNYAIPLGLKVNLIQMSPEL